MSAWPIRYKNSSGSTIPAYGLFRLSNAARETSGELIPQGNTIATASDEALFVNSGQACGTSGASQYGWCRSVLDSPFWVTYDGSNAPAQGDIVGPVDGQTYVNTKGAGFLVLFKDTAKGLVRCAFIGIQQIWDAELTASMSAASNDKTGAATASAKLLVQNPASAGNLTDGPTITVTNRSLDSTGLSGDYILVARVGNEWRPVWVDC